MKQGTHLYSMSIVLGRVYLSFCHLVVSYCYKNQLEHKVVHKISGTSFILVKEPLWVAKVFLQLVSRVLEVCRLILCVQTIFGLYLREMLFF